VCGVPSGPVAGRVEFAAVEEGAYIVDLDVAAVGGGLALALFEDFFVDILLGACCQRRV